MSAYLPIDSPSTLQTGMDILEIFAEAQAGAHYIDDRAGKVPDGYHLGGWWMSRTTSHEPFTCDTCKKKFEKTIKASRTPRFCSKKCSNAFHNAKRKKKNASRPDSETV